ncbi:MAG: type II toxin-antitoxin system RelE/ParE family toxin [Phycisphaeraceae bacterium]|nr:type II toxin-antitoxin system RelE/ParE family toxin [Phycisphaeraceae bacterium]MBX3405982.1 type II toxin-antitoxin system RelE/ParE family toxin [Phycisphaeraceae bacterium]
MVPRSFRIVVMPRAHRDLIDLEAFIARDSPRNAAALGDRVLARLRSLRTMPNRYPVYLPAGEFPFDVRCMSVRPCRVLYSVAGTRVVILRIRHAKQQDLGAQEF